MVQWPSFWCGFCEVFSGAALWDPMMGRHRSRSAIDRLSNRELEERIAGHKTAIVGQMAALVVGVTAITAAGLCGTIWDRELAAYCICAAYAVGVLLARLHYERLIAAGF